MVVSETRHAEVLQMWSRVWRVHAFIILVTFAITSVMRWCETSAVFVGVLWSTAIVAIIAVVWFYRFRDGGQMTVIEKQLGQVWGMFGVTAVLTGVLNHTMGFETLQLMPMIALECGFAFCCMAAILGGSFYLIGIACFVTGMLMPFAPELVTAVFGLVVAIGLLVPAIRYSSSGE